MNDEQLTIGDAWQALREGDSLTAVVTAEALVQTTEITHGAGHPATARAWFELGCIRSASGDLRGAVADLRKAAEIPGVDGDSLKEQLTYNMNLGELLLAAGDPESAEEVLREGLQLRGAFYGEQHPGFAYGLESLASVLLVRDNSGEAQSLAEEAVVVMRQAGHERLPRMWVLRAQARAATGLGSLFERTLSEANEDQVDVAVDEALKRGRTAPAQQMLPVLAAMSQQLEIRFGRQHNATVRALSGLANVGQRAGAHDVRRASLARLVDILDHAGDPKQAQEAVLALALADSDAGDFAAAEQHYREAIERATHLPDRQSATWRNFGLFLADRHRRVEAEPALVRGMETAKTRGELGRSLLAYGIFLQHAGRADEAEQCLIKGLEMVPEPDPDALAGRSHLSAIRNGGGCGCGKMELAISEALKAMVLAQVPDGLLSNLSWEPDSGIHVELSREPTPDELDLLNRVIKDAHHRLRKGLKKA